MRTAYNSWDHHNILYKIIFSVIFSGCASCVSTLYTIFYVWYTFKPKVIVYNITLLHT